jgi:WS/DGAT/MGAT family acyltransferase
MRQLTSLDAMFLNMESGRIYGHVSGLSLYDASTRPSGRLTLDDVRAHVRERLHLLGPFRWRLVRVPFDLDNPYWIEDGEFDLDFHIRELALPTPGTREQLAEQVARLVSRPLDRSRPLWELYLIQGLEDGLVAQLTKIHHAAIDGVSGAEILSVLLDRSPEGQELPARTPRPTEQQPGELAMLARGLMGLAMQPWRTLTAARRTVPNLQDVPFLGNLPAVRHATRDPLRAPRTPLNGRVTPHRRTAFVSLPLEEVKAVKNAFGVTVNDVVLGLSTTAVRRWLLDRGALPTQPLLAAVPISVRPQEERTSYGNQVSLMVVPLPTHLDDQAEQLRALHQSTKAAKERHNAIPATLLQDASQFIPPALAARASRVLSSFAASGRGTLPINTVVSNVPGSRSPLFCAGARLVANYPISAILDGVGLNISLLSHEDHLDFGIVTDRELVPDPWTLAQYMEEALLHLGSHATKQARSSRTRNSTTRT